MRILTLSLLRLGDFFHHVHLLREIRRKSASPGVEIHVLAFSDCQVAAKLFPEFHFHFIPRLEMQTELVERHRSWRRAVHLLRENVRLLNEYDFSEALNLTHTHFSARIMDLIRCEQKRGLQYVNGQAQLATPGLHYVNEIWAFENEPLFNWIDATAASLEIPEPPVLTSTSRAIVTGQEVWLQPLTSDAKKNWSLPKWKDLARRLKKQGVAVRIIAAPGEAALLSTALGEDVFELTFEEIRLRAPDCQLLVAGDTSVLHFAVLEGIPVMGLYLGPANPYKTPPRQRNAMVWWGHVGCSPCAHRAGCSQPSRVCEESLGTESVELSILAKLKSVEIGSHLVNADAWYGEVQSFGRVHFRRFHVERFGSVSDQSTATP